MEAAFSLFNYNKKITIVKQKRKWHINEYGGISNIVETLYTRKKQAFVVLLESRT